MTEKQNNLKRILAEKRCFKLVCGAGNEDPVEVEKLVALYAKAGAVYFDLSAREDVVKAAQKAIKRVIPKKDCGKYFLNISVGIEGDPHLRKAKIDVQKCIKCGACTKICPQKAIENNQGKYIVAGKKCIGCGSCEKICPVKAIEFIYKNENLRKILPPLIKMGIDSIELHANTDEEKKSYEQWKIISTLFGGMLSLCLDRSHLGDKMLINRIKKFILNREKYETIIQADGAPMSGSKDDFNTTLQAIATADIVQKASLPVWLLLSGGTNSKTSELAKLCGINAHGVSIGSFARKIVKPYIEREDFLENKKIFNEALFIAKGLVNKTLNNLKND